MDANDQQAIRTLFEKLADVERQASTRDAEAEQFIDAAITRQPGAPYYMAQTVVVQEHALTVAQARIEELEGALAEARQTPQGGGFLAGLFGAGSAAPRQAARTTQPMPQGAPGGFLAGAAQTAMGVAGGMMLANMLGGMFGGPAEAGEVTPEDAADFGDDGSADLGDW